MQPQKRMPRYDVRNDGAGPYAVFYCGRCEREYRSAPDVRATITQDVGRRAMGGLLRNIPVVGWAAADSLAGQDPRYIQTLTPEQLDAAWQQVADNFRECPTCRLVVCLADFDLKSGYCTEDSPRRAEIAQAQAEQGAAMALGLANAFGLGTAMSQAVEAARVGAISVARCPNDGTVRPAGTKFCPECGSPMLQPTAVVCSSCGAETRGAKFCPNCGAKQGVAAAAASCQSCGTELKGAKFCPNCGAKAGA